MYGPSPEGNRVRGAYEGLGYSVSWDPGSQQIVVSKSGYQSRALYSGTDFYIGANGAAYFEFNQYATHLSTVFSPTPPTQVPSTSPPPAWAPNTGRNDIDLEQALYNWLKSTPKEAFEQIGEKLVKDPNTKPYDELSWKEKLELDKAVWGMSPSEALINSFLQGILIGWLNGGWLKNKYPIEQDYYSSPSNYGSSATNIQKPLGNLKIIDGGNYSASEVRAAEYMRDLGNDVILRPPTGTRAGGTTSDLLVNGVTYDVYTPITSNSSRIIGAIAAKNSQANGIVLDLSETSVTAQDLGNILGRVIGVIEKSGKNVNISDIIVLPK